MRSKAKQDNTRGSKKLKLNNKKYSLCGWNSWSVKELVAEKPLEWFIDKLKDIAAINKGVLCWGGLTKEEEGARPETRVHVYFSKII